jgi:hypothetical protein
MTEKQLEGLQEHMNGVTTDHLAAVLVVLKKDLTCEMGIVATAMQMSFMSKNLDSIVHKAISGEMKTLESLNEKIN